MRSLLPVLLLCACSLGAAVSEVLHKDHEVEIVRVLAEPAHKTRDHEHKINRVMVYLDEGAQVTTYADGRVVREPWKAGEAIWSPAEGMHRVVYETTAEVGLVKVELQQMKPIGSPALGPLDPLKVAPQFYAVEMENEQVRVIRVKVPAGATIPLHSHARKRAVIYLTPAKFEVQPQEGGSTTSTFQRGDVVWTDAQATHTEINRGGDFEGLLVELK